MIYQPLTEPEVKPGIEVIYHPFIGSDNKCKETKITSDIWVIGESPCVRVEDISGGVFLESLELKEKYDRRKTKRFK